MKTLILNAVLSIAIITMFSCSNKTESEAHTHEDGSTHADHDTTKPDQQEFIVGDSTQKDSSHTHTNGEKHSH